MDSCIYLNHEFINLYTEENPMLEAGDECFFAIFNKTDYHIPVIARGTIVKDTFVDGFNKQYHIRLIEFIDTPKIINKHIIRKSLIVYPVLNGQILPSKTYQITPNFNFEKHLFKVEAFFVRKNIDDILQLRKEYCSHLRKDLNQMINEIDNL